MLSVYFLARSPDFSAASQLPSQLPVFSTFRTSQLPPLDCHQTVFTSVFCLKDSAPEPTPPGFAPRSDAGDPESNCSHSQVSFSSSPRPPMTELGPRKMGQNPSSRRAFSSAPLSFWVLRVSNATFPSSRTPFKSRSSCFLTVLPTSAIIELNLEDTFCTQP